MSAAQWIFFACFAVVGVLNAVPLSEIRRYARRLLALASAGPGRNAADREAKAAARWEADSSHEDKSP